MNYFMDWLDQGGPYIKGRKTFRIHSSSLVKDIVTMGVHSGLTKAEIGALTKDSIDLENECIRVRRVLNLKTSTIKVKVVSISAEIRPVLKKSMTCSPMFRVSMNPIKYFARTCRLAGLPEILFDNLRNVFIEASHLDDI